MSPAVKNLAVQHSQCGNMIAELIFNSTHWQDCHIYICDSYPVTLLPSCFLQGPQLGQNLQCGSEIRSQQNRWWGCTTLTWNQTKVQCGCYYGPKSYSRAVRTVCSYLPSSASVVPADTIHHHQIIMKTHRNIAGRCICCYPPGSNTLCWWYTDTYSTHHVQATFRQGWFTTSWTSTLSHGASTSAGWDKEVKILLWTDVPQNEQFSVASQLAPAWTQKEGFLYQLENLWIL